MPIELPALIVSATVPLWAWAASRASRQIAQRRQALVASERTARLALDEAVTRIAWRHEVVIVRDARRVGARIEGEADGQRFCFELDLEGWSLAIDVQPVLPGKVEIHARATPPTTEELDPEERTGHAAFDRHYRVDPAGAVRELPGSIVELLGRRPIAGLSMAGHQLRIQGRGRLEVEPGAPLGELQRARTLARELEAHVRRGPRVASRLPSRIGDAR